MVKKKGSRGSASVQTHQTVNPSKAKAAPKAASAPKVESDDIPGKPLSPQERRQLNQLVKESRWRRRKRYRGIHGKVVDWVSHSIQDGHLYISIRFKDKTDFSLCFFSKIVVAGIDLSDMKTGDFQLIREYPRLEQAL